MNWESIIIAIIAGMGASLIGLVPAYWGIRRQMKKDQDDASAKRVDQELERQRLNSTVIDTAQRVAQQTIESLVKRIDELEQDLKTEREARQRIELELDTERKKRREAELNLALAEDKIRELQKKVEKLEKKDTGELKLEDK